MNEVVKKVRGQPCKAAPRGPRIKGVDPDRAQLSTCTGSEEVAVFDLVEAQQWLAEVLRDAVAAAVVELPPRATLGRLAGVYIYLADHAEGIRRAKGLPGRPAQREWLEAIMRDAIKETMQAMPVRPPNGRFEEVIARVAKHSALSATEQAVLRSLLC